MEQTRELILKGEHLPTDIMKRGVDVQSTPIVYLGESVLPQESCEFHPFTPTCYYNVIKT
jgi:hypothetical protein